MESKKPVLLSRAQFRERGGEFYKTAWFVASVEATVGRVTIQQ